MALIVDLCELQDRRIVSRVMTGNALASPAYLRICYISYSKRRRRQPWWHALSTACNPLFLPRDTIAQAISATCLKDLIVSGSRRPDYSIIATNKQKQPCLDRVCQLTLVNIRRHDHCLATEHLSNQVNRRMQHPGSGFWQQKRLDHSKWTVTRAPTQRNLRHDRQPIRVKKHSGV